ncbi:hypothetical protein VTG60DRAFT_3929 [Thermothelomyces hinnuleus]
MPLEDLPPEVLMHIMALSSCPSDLRALASISRRIYSVYESDRAALLYRALANALGPVMADAVGYSHLEPLMPWGYSFFGDKLGDALARYRGYLAGQDHHRSPRGLSLDHVLRLVRRYDVTAEMAKMYLDSTLRLLAREAAPAASDRSPPAGGGGGANPPDVLLTSPPSRAEWLRVVRAHYRLQMAYRIWHGCSCAGLGWGSAKMRAAGGSLFGLWEPWEIQQVFCVGAFCDRLRARLSRAAVAVDDEDDLKRECRSVGVIYSLDGWRDLVRRVRAADEQGWQRVLDDVARFREGRPDAAGAEEEQSLLFHQNKIARHHQGVLLAPLRPPLRRRLRHRRASRLGGRLRRQIHVRLLGEGPQHKAGRSTDPRPLVAPGLCHVGRPAVRGVEVGVLSMACQNGLGTLRMSG